MQILIVEDEPRLARSIQKWLLGENFSVDIAFDGDMAMEMFSRGYDLIILDYMLPKRNWAELLSHIRAEYGAVLVMFLTARSSTEEKIAGLNLWADDYLAKPFDFNELLARIQALLRRSMRHDVVLSLDSLSLNTQTKSVTRAGKDIGLSATEYRLLEYFLRHPGHVLSESMLLDRVWDHSYDGLSNVVSVYVRYLRNKIDKPFIAEKPLIHTVRGLGYCISDSRG